VLEDQIQNLTKVLEGGGKCSSGTKKGVEIEGVPFNDEQDLKVWVEQELPSSFPFGCFVDIYSFLDRILQTSGGLKDLEINHKLYLSEDEALTLSGFMREVPRIFGQSVAATSSSLKTYSK